MDKRLKQRLIGAAVLIALAVIFLPMLLTGRGSHPVSMQIKLPPEPDYHFSSNAQKPLAPLTSPPSTTTLTAIPNMTTETPIAPVATPASAPSPAAAPLPATAPPPKAPASPVVSPKPPQAPTPTDQVAAKASPPASITKPAGHPVLSAWVIQVASLVDPHGATQLRDRLRKAGYAAYVDRITIHGKTYYRVRVGPRSSRSQAEKVLIELEHKVKLKGMLVPYP